MSHISHLLVILVLSLGCAREDTSEPLLNEIDNWYYKHKCIESTNDEEGNIIERNAQEKEFMIKAAMINLRLDEKWSYDTQYVDITKITLSEYVAKFITVFENNSGEYFFYNELYYFDLDAINPIPLKYYSAQTGSNSSVNNIVRYLWRGDFNEYLRYFYRLEMKPLDTIK